MVWTDSHGKSWDVELAPRRIVMKSPEAVLDLPSEHWNRDIYVSKYGDGYLIRVDTFANSMVFQIPSVEAAPFLRHVLHGRGQPNPEDPGESKTAVSEAPAMALLWPKVSPLAVWALISSALVFVPVIGCIPAAVTTVLLILHRKRVRRSAAWHHSRTVCKAAFAFLVGGLSISALATYSLVRQYAAVDEPIFKSGRVRPATVEPETQWSVGSMSLPAPLAAGINSPMTSSCDRAALASFTPVVSQSPCHETGRRSFVTLAWTQPVWERDYNWGIIAASLFVVLASLTVHEAAHAITAWWVGDDFARRLGRVTLNPAAHVDPIGTIILPICLFLADAGIFGWAKPVPVRLDYVQRPRRAHILIALAGPGSNLLLAAASLATMLALGCLVNLLAPEARVHNFANPVPNEAVDASGFVLASAFGAACTLLKLSFVVNVFLAFFNLIPIPPLDGSWVLGHLFPFTLGRFFDRIRPISFLLFLGLVYSGVLHYLILPAVLAVLPGFLLLDLCTLFLG